MYLGISAASVLVGTGAACGGRTNTDAAEIPRYIQLHASQVYQWHQMVNAEDILKQKVLGSQEEN